MGNRLSVSRKTKKIRSANTTDQIGISSKMVNIHQEATIINTATSVNPTTLDLKREFHNEKSSTYWLPKDDEEQIRLTGV